MSYYLETLLDLLARFRLVCEARGIDPKDVRLEDLIPIERERLRFLAEADFRDLVSRPAVERRA